MRQAGKIAIWLGLASLVVGIYARWTVVRLHGMEAQAFLQFTQACFLFSIAAFMASCEKK